MIYHVLNGDSLAQSFPEAKIPGEIASETISAAFPYMQEVIKAHIDRFPKVGESGRPEKVVEEIVKNVSMDFPVVLSEFWKRESIYGFGDLQLRKIYDNVISRR